MLKISESQSASRRVILRLEGRVIGPWVSELQQSCESVLREGRPLCLQLAGVEYLDAEGVALLRRLRAQGAQLRELSPFVREQLKRVESLAS